MPFLYNPKTGTFAQNSLIDWTDLLGSWRSPWTIYDDASKDAYKKFDPDKFPDSLHNGLGDAYRHCLASCMMAREDGLFAAKTFGWANEKKGDWMYNQERGEREMDDFNNAYGRQCGKDAKDTKDCQQKCMSAVNSGNLKTYNSGTTPGY